jgi:hypothetical protein
MATIRTGDYTEKMTEELKLSVFVDHKDKDRPLRTLVCSNCNVIAPASEMSLKYRVHIYGN